MRSTKPRVSTVMAIAVTVLLSGCGHEGPGGPASILAVTAVSPTTGLTGGGLSVRILGTAFKPGAIVTFGGVQAAATVSTGDIRVITPAHAAGAVDIAITNPSGESIVVARGFTYTVGTRPMINAISPSLGSTAGGDLQMRITGSGFQAGTRITLGGVSLPGLVINATTIAPTALIPAHAAGTVDVAVSNPDGQSATITNGFTYVPPDSFDANGRWEGGFFDDLSMLKFTIENNLLTSASCGASEVFTFMPPPVMSGGAFSASRADGVSISGRIVAPFVTNGTVNIPGCPVTPWVAEKK